jgi:hypothetical protein
MDRDNCFFKRDAVNKEKVVIKKYLMAHVTIRLVTWN